MWEEREEARRRAEELEEKLRKAHEGLYRVKIACQIYVELCQ
ncbi:MAG: hypothetical protein NY202_01800 [Mollicutes bacterium UO1]